MQMQSKPTEDLKRKIVWVIGIFVILILIAIIYTLPTAFRFTTPPTGTASSLPSAGHLTSAGPLAVKGCLVKKQKSNQVILEFRNNSMTAISNLKITKAQLAHRSVLNPHLPIVIKSIRGRSVQKVVLEFPETTSRYFKLELEFQGGILGSGSGSISCGVDLPLCSPHSSTNP